MPTIEQWVEWARTNASPYWGRNHCDFLFVAATCCRYYRDPALGMTTNEQLACADHYWFTRLVYFHFTGIVRSDAAGREAARRMGGTAATSSGVAAAVSRIASDVESAVAAAAFMPGWSVATCGWEALKRIAFAIGHPEWIPGDGVASAPTSDQRLWVGNALIDCVAQDLRFAYQFEWNHSYPSVSVPRPPT